MSADKYRTIVADPPWHYDDMPSAGKRVPLPYPTMTLDEIDALPVAGLAERDAHLYVWTTNRFLEAAYGTARAWGFRPAQLVTWCKQPSGLGFGGAFPSTTEFVVFARRGSLRHTGRANSAWFQWKRGPHSAKPEAFLDLVEQVSPGPYLEMFSRRQRFGWDTWGDQSFGDVTLDVDEAIA